MTEQERLVLIEGHRTAPTIRKADRIKTILLLDKGYSYQEIAAILLFDEKTGRRYYDEYQSGGLDKLMADNYLPYSGKMNLEQEQKLVEHLKQTTYHSTAPIVLWIEEMFGIKYTTQGLVHTLHRLGFSYKKSKLVPGKADPDKQKAHLDNLEKLKATLGEDDRIYYVDGVHQLHNPEVGYGWIFKGTEKEVPANTGRNRLNINGAIDASNKEVIVRKDDTINAQSTIKLFEEIESRNPAASKIIVIADNAKYYKNKSVKEYLKTSKIEIVFLPPYSPNLNLIERLWKFFKKKVMRDQYYETYDIFRSACMSFFENIDEYRAELDTLITENFQIIESPLKPLNGHS